MSTLEEVKKAYEDLSDEDKKSFHESIADRIHESVGEQEAKNGEKDEQTAADREHEALGEEHADGEGKVDELGETDDEDEVKADKELKADDDAGEKETDSHDWKTAFEDFKKDIIAAVTTIVSENSKSGESGEVDKKAKEIYGLGNGVFGAEEEPVKEKKMSGTDIAELLRKTKN